MMDSQVVRQQLRQQLRQQRRSLDERECSELSSTAIKSLVNHRLFRAAKHIACYLPNDGELDLTPLMAQAWAMGKTVYLPVLSSIHRNHLHFLPYEPGDALAPNRFGIPEPIIRSRRITDIKRLDLVFAPLIAFDDNGNRLGMGGGFYDRSFAFLRRRRFWRKPRLIGVAYDFQKTAGLAGNPWDVPLDGVATESGVQMFTEWG